MGKITINGDFPIVMLNYQRVINYIINHTTGGLPKTSKIRAKFLSTLENCLAKMDIDPIAHSGPATRMILKKILKDRLHAAEKKMGWFPVDLQSKTWSRGHGLSDGVWDFRCEIPAEEKKQDPQAGQGGDGHPQMVNHPNSMGVSYHEDPNSWMLVGGFKHEWIMFHHIWDILYI